MFKIGDWVQITPTPDLRWNQWYNSKDIYQNFLDRIGVIDFISDDDERPGESLYAVKVDFPDGLENLPPGSYYEWFRSDHLIMSSRSLANLRHNMAEAGKQLQEWEAFKKKTTDDMLRSIFAPKENIETNDINKTGIDPWNLKTPVDQGYDEKYDTYYDDDPTSYIFEYTNNTDIDHSYYADMSDAKKKEKDQ